MIASSAPVGAPPPAPFVHVLSHGGRWYAYDVNTNGILAVDPALGRTLAALGAPEPARALDTVARDLGHDAVHAALAEIAQAQRDEGLFLAQRPEIGPRRFGAADFAAYQNARQHLILSVTDACNLACRYCPQAAARARPGARRPRAMSRAVALRALHDFLDHCGEAPHPAVSFYGGEPLLRPDLIRAVVAAARARRDARRVRFIVDTNGTLLDDAAVELIAREGLHLQVSLDGPAVAHDRWRVRPDGSGSHAAVMAGLARLLKRDPSAAGRLSFQVTLAPPYELDGLMDWANGLQNLAGGESGETPRLRLAVADLACVGPPTQRGKADGRNAHTAQLMRARTAWLEARTIGGGQGLDVVSAALFDHEVVRVYHRRWSRLAARFLRGAGCVPGVRRLLVLPDGRMAPCERTADGLLVGDVTLGLDEKRAEELVHGFVSALAGRCSSCWAVRMCDLCLATMTRDEQTGSFVVEAAACTLARERAAHRLELYADLMSHGAEAAAFLRGTRLT